LVVQHSDHAQRLRLVHGRRARSAVRCDFRNISVSRSMRTERYDLVCRDLRLRARLR
jgi:hypothetical protein